MNKKVLCLSLLTMTMSLSGCFFNKRGGNKKQQYDHSDLIARYEKDEYENDNDVVLNSKDMSAYVYTGKKITTVETFYRTDKITKMPHISLKTYYKLLLKKDISIERTNDSGDYVVRTPNGGEALINTVNDTLVSDDYEKFIDTTQYRQDDVSNTYFDGAPFVRVIDTIVDKAPARKEISFRKYHINLIGKDDDIILPLVTASNMFQGPTMITTFYNANTMYIVDPNDPNFETSHIVRNTDYYRGMTNFFENGKRSEDTAIFAYGELCFLIDTYYGLPGRESLHEKLMSRDLHKALGEQDEYTQRVRHLLISPVEEEYLAGYMILQDYLSDAGHTVANYGASMYMRVVGANNRVSSIINNIGYELGSKEAPSNYSSTYYSRIVSAKNFAGLEDLDYKVSGDTVIYSFDQFDFDIYDWNDFYAGEKEMPKDAIGNLYRTLNRYKSSSTVKNFVIDISTNFGGYADLVFTIISLISNNAYFHYHDMINDNFPTTYYAIDRNFDGSFDELDDEVSYNYNFAILCSSLSFSCGNILPAQAKECGVMILGDQSGGGCCAVLDCINAEGMYVRLSSQAHIVMKDGTEIENGVPVHVNLVKENNDFSEFFDFNVISQAMHNFYNN